MAKGNNQKIKILKIYEILSMYSDEQKPITTTEIIERLNKEGIDCKRKALYDDIKTLNEFGYEVLQERKKQNEYFVVDRKFDLPELKFLIDAVECSNFITEKKSKQLIEKIANLSGSFKGELLTHDIIYQNDLKRTNEKIYYTIDAIEEAINNQKQIEFKYFDTDILGNKVYRKNGKIYTINPVKLTISDNKYYLICYDNKHNSLSSYRVDRIDDIVVTNKDKIVKECENDKNVKEYLKGLFSMYNGTKETIDLKVKKDVRLIEVINDQFGKNKAFINEDDSYYYIRVDVVISNTFFAWLTTFSGDIVIDFPSNVKKQYIKFLQNNISIYNNN